MLLLFLGAGPATVVSTAADAFQADAFQTDALAFQTTPVAAPIQPSESADQGAGVRWRSDFAPSRKKLKRLLEEAGVAEPAMALEFEGDDWSDEEILLLLEVV